MVVEIIRAQESMKKIAEPYFEKCGVSFVEGCILIAIGTQAATTQRDLIDETRFGKVTISRACEMLARRNLLKRYPHDTDMRMHYLELTVAGQEMKGRLLEAKASFQSWLEQTFTRAELLQFGDLLGRVETNCNAIVLGRSAGQGLRAGRANGASGAYGTSWLR